MQLELTSMNIDEDDKNKLYIHVKRIDSPFTEKLISTWRGWDVIKAVDILSEHEVIVTVEAAQTPGKDLHAKSISVMNTLNFR